MRCLKVLETQFIKISLKHPFPVDSHIYAQNYASMHDLPTLHGLLILIMHYPLINFECMHSVH